MAESELVRLRHEQLDEASALLGRAFHDDPAWVWVLPDAARRQELLPWLFRLGFEVTEGEVWTTPGRVLGCARWLPPGRPPVRIARALRAFVVVPLRLREATSRFLAYGRAVESLRAQAAPFPHWYLAGIGVEPAEQRKGIGSALIGRGIENAASDSVPCVLLTNAERNLAFYRHHGFEVVREGDTPAGGPPAWALVREP
jgi:ribosomal protein S18 acetylase RimI-like enzyme